MLEIRFEVKSAEQAQDLTKVYETPAKLIITSHQGIGKHLLVVNYLIH